MGPAIAPALFILEQFFHVYYITHELMGRDSKKIIKLLVQGGWFEFDVSGSHHHFKHPSKPGKVTIPHPVKNLPTGTVRSVLRQAGLLDRKTKR